MIGSDMVGGAKKYVAAECFSDDALQAVVRANLSSTFCSFSGATSSRPIAAPLDVVVAHILEGLSRHYQDAAEEVGHDEGEYVGAAVCDTYDLVESEVELASHMSDELLQAIVDELPGQMWSDIDPYGPREGDVMNWSWKEFTEKVKHKSRFFFNGHRKADDPRSEIVSLTELLEEVTRDCREFGLVVKYPPGQEYFRCRPREKGERFSKPSEMGPPPKVNASQSRMSPAGVPMFYGALDEKTARAETLAKPGRHAIARFVTIRPIALLDLRKRPYVSIFDLKKGHLRGWARFMKEFIDDLQKPVAHDGEQHFEYVPTQVVTEYMHTALTGDDSLDGIIYSSVKNKGGDCVVLFADAESVDPVVSSSSSAKGKYLLRMKSVAHHR